MISSDYRLAARCHVCGKDYKARYNAGRRARVCTPPAHKCKKVGKDACTERCCRSKYRRAASDAAMDAAIDPRKVLSEGELDATLKATRKLRDPEGICLRFIAATGVRMGEALLVRAMDCLWSSGPYSTISVPTLKRSGGGRPRRSIHIDNASPLLKELKAWVGEIKEPSDMIFPVARRTLQTALEVVLLKIKPDREALVHIFRHTRASQLVKAGAPLNYVRQQLGWASLEMAKVYTHTDEAEIASVLKKMR